MASRAAGPLALVYGGIAHATGLSRSAKVSGRDGALPRAGNELGFAN